MRLETCLSQFRYQSVELALRSRIWILESIDYEQDLHERQFIAKQKGMEEC